MTCWRYNTHKLLILLVFYASPLLCQGQGNGTVLNSPVCTEVSPPLSGEDVPMPQLQWDSDRIELTYGPADLNAPPPFQDPAVSFNLKFGKNNVF